jgi:hypothetical protein
MRQASPADSSKRPAGGLPVAAAWPTARADPFDDREKAAAAMRRASPADSPECPAGRLPVAAAWPTLSPMVSERRAVRR